MTFSHHHVLPDIHSVTKDSYCACGFVLSKEAKKVMLTPEWQESNLAFWDAPDPDCKCDDCLMDDDE